MKRFLALLLSLCMILSLAACGDTKDDTPATQPKATEEAEPEVTEPEVTEPEVTEPEVTEPEETEPEVVEPEVPEVEFVEPEVEEIVTDGDKNLEKLSMKNVTVTGSTPWNNCNEVCTNAVDGDISTYFDGVANGWMEIDFGGKVKFDVIGYAPRSSFQARMKDGMFYVSDDGDDWTLVYTVESVPAYKINYAYLDQTYECRYIRYDVPSGYRDNGEEYLANIAEVGIYRTVEAEAETEAETEVETEAETEND